eukprot:m.155549 g.155549  ORF g.155549 m.155549 type:complete len:802 (-) comp30939_c1_seq10:63-2468(-)
MMLVFLAVCVVLTKTFAATPPTIFWNSEGHVENTTVLALGGGLSNVTVQVCTDSMFSHCVAADVLQQWEGSVKFVLPIGNLGSTTEAAVTSVVQQQARGWWFRVCPIDTATNNPGICSSWRTINKPQVWWVQGDSSSSSQAVVTPGGWLRVHGRSLGFAYTTKLALGSRNQQQIATNCPAATPSSSYPGFINITLVPTSTSSSSSVATPTAPISSVGYYASCYDGHMSIPIDARAGAYSLHLDNGLGNGDTGMSVLVVNSKPWPSTQFPVAVGEDVAKAIAAAGAAGGGVVLLAAGKHSLSDVLQLTDGVQLVGASTSGTSLPSSSSVSSLAILSFASPLLAPKLPFISLSNSSTSWRYAIRNVVIDIQVPSPSYVIDVGGHGVEINHVTVTMPTQTGKQLSSIGSVVHTHGTAFSITNSTFTHAQETCTSPGYPRDCLLFFDFGTNNGLVQNNTFNMGCCAFEGYSSNGVIVDSNTFVDMPNAVQPDGNGFATFGGARVSERISFSRNMYQGMFNGDNVVDGSYPHEAFTSDGNGGDYAGSITSATHNSVTVPKKVDSHYIGAVLAVLSGTGEGQSLRITGTHDNTYTLEEKGFAVELDHTSVIVVAPYVGHVIVMGNAIKNSTTVQIFGSGFDTIYAGNVLAHMYSDKVVHPGGLSLMALDYQGGYQPNINFEVIQNTVHDVVGGLGILIDGNPGNMSLSHGHVVRDNLVTDKWVAPFNFSSFDGAITVGVDAQDTTCGCRKTTPPQVCCFGSVKNAVKDVVVEGNTVILRSGKGNCNQNGVRVFAENSINRANKCLNP